MMTPERKLAWQRKRLALWLAEWQLEEGLRRVGAPDGGVARTGDAAGGVVPGRALWRGVGSEIWPAVGQIRLLAPEAASVAAAWPVFFAILELLPGEVLRVAPFGRFAEPAVPGEWKTRRKRNPLRVLCLWNARQFSVKAAALSWCVDALTPGELARARAVYAHAMQGAPLNDPPARDVGPPLVHPDDPRQVYCYREEARMDQLARELASRYFVPERQATDLLRAAEGPPDEIDPPGPKPSKI